MILKIFDAFILGWYYLLRNTVYLHRDRNSEAAIGPKEHSLFILFLVLLVDLFSVLNYFNAKLFLSTVNPILVLLIAITLFIAIYIVYIKHGRVKRITLVKSTNNKIIAYIVFTITFSILSGYLMVSLGNEIRGIIQIN